MAIGGWATGEMLDEVYAHTTDRRMEEAIVASEIRAYPGVLPSQEKSVIPAEPKNKKPPFQAVSFSIGAAGFEPTTFWSRMGWAGAEKA